MSRAPRSNERHHIPAPTETQEGDRRVGHGAYVDGCKERIHDLFKTLAGLPGHQMQVQQEMNRLARSGITGEEEKRVAHQLFDQIAKAAEYATFDFPQQMFTVGKNFFYISREGGKVIYYKV